jgi:hypothetical protein
MSLVKEAEAAADRVKAAANIYTRSEGDWATYIMVTKAPLWEHIKEALLAAEENEWLLRARISRLKAQLDRVLNSLDLLVCEYQDMPGVNEGLFVEARAALSNIERPSKD